MDGPYYSRFHPHRAPDLQAFRTALLRPLATCLLALAIALLTRVLQAQPPGLWLVLGLPAALLLALGWTAYWMQQTPAELHLHAEGLMLRSVWDVLTDRQPPPRPLLGVRRDHDRTHLFCADALYTLRDLDWPEAPQLVEALRHRFAHANTASASAFGAMARSSSAPA